MFFFQSGSFHVSFPDENHQDVCVCVCPKIKLGEPPHFVGCLRKDFNGLFLLLVFLEMPHPHVRKKGNAQPTWVEERRRRGQWNCKTWLTLEGEQKFKFEQLSRDFNH